MTGTPAAGGCGAVALEILWWFTPGRPAYWTPKAEREAAAAQRRIERDALRQERAQKAYKASPKAEPNSTTNTLEAPGVKSTN